MRTILSLFPPSAMIALSVWFLWFNPYQPMQSNPVTVMYVTGLLILPAICIIIATFLKMKTLKTVGLILSFPLALYLGLAGIPSYWSLMIIVWILFFFIDTGGRTRRNP